MEQSNLIPFFVYDKDKKEAYFIVLNPKTKIRGIRHGRKTAAVQKSALEWTSRPTMGA